MSMMFVAPLQSLERFVVSIDLLAINTTLSSIPTYGRIPFPRGVVVLHACIPVSESPVFQ